MKNKTLLEKKGGVLAGYKRTAFLRNFSTFIALAVIWIILSLISPHFLTLGNMSNMLVQAANIMLVATGLTFVLICGQIDLSLGSIEALTGAVVSIAIINWGMPMIPAIILAVLIGMLCGLVNGFFIAQFSFPPFIATLGMMGIARGFALITTGGTAVYGFPDSFKFLGQGMVGPIPFPVIAYGVILVIAFIVLKFTRYGVNVYATGGNAEAAALSGINVKFIKMSVMGLAGFLAALAGIIMTARLNSGQATIGAEDVNDSIASVVIGGTSLSGGTGGIVGTLVGVMIITSIRNGLNILGVTSYWQQVCIGTIILLAVLIDLFGKKQGK